MRVAVVVATVLGLLAGCVAGEPPVRDPQECLRLFERYDRVERRSPGSGGTVFDGRRTPPPDLARAAQQLVVAGCQTRGRDLDGMEAHAATLVDFRIIEGPTAMRRAPVHLGVVTSIADERRVTQVFRGLGYNSRGIGAQGLGRRIFIGPFDNPEAAEQAIEIARAMGFIAPYLAERTRF